MRRVSSADFVRNFSALCDDALSEPLVLTRNGRDRLVVVEVSKFQQLAENANPPEDNEPDAKKAASGQ